MTVKIIVRGVRKEGENERVLVEEGELMIVNSNRDEDDD